jgi:hypothetical protein
MSERLVFCCGMFRSGTTLLGRILNAHPAMSVESDPFLNFFKVMRSDIASTLGLSRPPTAPIGDYYFSRDDVKLLNAVRTADLDSLTNDWDRSELWAFVRRHGQPYAPRIMDRLSEVQGRSYRELLQGMFDLAAAPRVTIHGVKEVWIDEFIPALAAAFPQMKFIEIVRDPRAVCASKNVKAEKYPWLFLCRQWRKLAAIAWSHTKQWKSLTGRVLLVRYEDLVREPEKQIRRMTDFLALPFAPEMLDSRNYIGGDGEQWIQNSSFDSQTGAVNDSSLEKWRNVLREEEIGFIESICGPEMHLLGYEPVVSTAADGVVSLSTAPCVPEKDLAGWIRKQYPSSLADTVPELAKEQLRADLLSLPAAERVKIDSGLIESAFLGSAVFEALSTPQ